MIPYSLCRGIVNQSIDFSIYDLSIYHFTFRLASNINIQEIELTFYFSNERKVEKIHIDCFKMEIDRGDPYAFVYRIELENEYYKALVKRMMLQYNRYIQLKINESDEMIANQLVHYPLENVCDASLVEFENRNIQQNISIHVPKVGIVVEDIKYYLQDPCFIEKYLAHYHIICKSVDYLYVGSQFCIHLLPDIQLVRQIENKNIVMMLPPVKEDEMEKIKQYIQQLPENIEIVVNDLGTLLYLQDQPYKITLGIHMLKHSKDVRKKYVETYLPKINEDYLNTLKKNMKVQRFSYESSNEVVKLNDSFDLYYPYYNMNLATYCSIYAIEVYGDTSKQQYVRNCEKYCKHQYKLYPKHLNMIGVHNGLFGIDINNKIEEYQSGRVVLNYEDHSWYEFNR